MKTTAKQSSRCATRCVLKLCLSAACVLVPIAAHAQAGACDELKARLAARIEASGVRGYSLEAVAATTPVPAGAKAIGNCEGGERKILYRRWGGASAAASSAVAAATAPAAPVARAPERPVEPPPKPPAPLVRPAVPVPAASVVAVRVPTPIQVTAPVLPTAADPPMAAPVRAAEALALAGPGPAIALAEEPALRQRLAGYVGTNWRWLLALLLAPLAVLGWFWRAHHLAYDKNGLPRGPRL